MRTEAGNFIPAPSFDTDVEYLANWENSDADVDGPRFRGEPSSGSVMVNKTPWVPMSAFRSSAPCVPVIPGRPMQFSAWQYQPSPRWSPASAALLQGGSHVSGALLGSSGVNSYEFGAWTFVERRDGGACRRARRSPLAHRGQDSREWHVLGLLRRGLRTEHKAPPSSPAARLAAFGDGAGRRVGMARSDTVRRPGSRARGRAAPDDGRTVRTGGRYATQQPARSSRPCLECKSLAERATDRHRASDFREALEREAREKN